MRSRKSLQALVLVVLVVVALAGVWFLFAWSGPQSLRQHPLEEASAAHEASSASTSIEAHAPTNDDERSRASIPSEPSASWHVRVLEREKREPVAGARVRLSKVEWIVAGKTIAEGETGSDGIVELRAHDGSDVREADLTVDHPSFAPSRVASVKAGESRDVLLTRAGEILGHCEPPPGTPADVMLFEQISENPINWSVRHATSDAHGDFRFTQLRSGDYALTANVPGWSTSPQFSLRVEPAVVRDVTLSLLPESTLRGRLLTAANQAPMPGVRVSIMIGDSQSVQFEGTSRPSTITDSNGRFEFRELPAAKLAIDFRASDAPAFRRVVTMQHAGELVEQDFIAPPMMHLRGRFLDREKNPIADIEASVVGSPDQRDLAETALRDFKANGRPSARSRADGTFEFTTLADPSAFLTLVHRQHAAGASQPSWESSSISIPRDGNEKDLGDIEVARLRSVHGFVRDEHSAPVANARIEASRPVREQLACSAISAEDGSFTIDAPQYGTKWFVRLIARADGLASDRITFNSPSTDSIVLVLHPVRTVNGRVIDGDGRGVPNVPITLGTQGDHRRGPRIGGGDTVERTDEFGHVRFTDVIAMESEVGIDSKVLHEWTIESRDPATIPADGNRDVTVILRRAESEERATVRGRIVRLPGLEELQNFRIEVLPAKGDTNTPDDMAIPWGSKLRGILDFSGDAFTLSNVSTGHVVLAVRGWRCSGAMIPLDLHPGDIVDVGDIELARTGEIWIKFVDATGRAVRGVKFSVHRIDKPELPVRALESGDSYTLNDVLCGTKFELRAERSGSADVVQRFEMPFEPKLDVTVRLE